MLGYVLALPPPQNTPIFFGHAILVFLSSQMPMYYLCVAFSFSNLALSYSSAHKNNGNASVLLRLSIIERLRDCCRHGHVFFTSGVGDNACLEISNSFGMTSSGPSQTQAKYGQNRYLNLDREARVSNSIKPPLGCTCAYGYSISGKLK